LIYAIVGNGCPKSRKERVHRMIQEVGADVAGKRVLWIKALSDFDMPFQLLKNLSVYYKRLFWIEYQDAD
jgi:hypothetical protein